MKINLPNEIEVDTDDLTLADRHAVRLAMGELAFVDGAGRVVEPDALDEMAVQAWRLALRIEPSLTLGDVMGAFRLIDFTR